MQETNEVASILIVEDSATQAEHLRHLLEANGYAVTIAPNGKEAFSLLRSHKPTLIISDILMPKMDGYQLCREIKANENLKDIPVILLTALSDSKDVLKGLECNADNFITKPYDDKYLLSRIHYILINRELRKNERMQIGVNVFFSGQKFLITSERQQILDLLLSTYEIAVQQNSELIKIRDELKELNEQLEQKVGENIVEKKELHDISMELAVSLFEVFEALKKISAGDPEVRISEESEVEIISKLKHMVNMAARSIAEMVDQSHEFAMVITEHFDVLHRVTKGELNARVLGISKVELLEAFNRVTNEMIESIRKAIAERDITGELLREGEKRFRDFAELLPQVVFEADRKGNLTFVNRQALDMFGYTQEEFKEGLNVKEMFIPEDGERAVRNMQRRLKGEEVGGVEYTARRKDGATFPVIAFASPVTQKNQIVGVRGILVDITERKRAEKELDRLATTDHLTGLYNRAKYEDIVEREIARFRRYRQPLSMLMFDIDHFKKINDTYGHSTGDSVLKAIADIVKSDIRKIDYLVRWGGEEFIIISPEIPLDDARALAERIRKIIESYEFSDAGRITVSFGVTEFREDDTKDSFIKKADAALYEAKGKGRNRVEIAA